ncbi:MAG TPA: glutamate formimidoyltransferase [Bryobacteraceae bacterium]|nr:glutamate formimidoyltransferase [Bryobacteraceae bacterium]
MAGPLVECVPNFSEGRDAAVVQAIEAAIGSVSGVHVLHSEMDPDHNRSVITFAGAPEPVIQGAFAGIKTAVARIDLRRHAGVHPRIGAADVVPFVPLAEVTLAACVAIARQTGERVWRELGVPVYFYEAAASSTERGPLENLRRRDLEHPALEPDLGGAALHPSAGACVIGARKLLIALNVNLKTGDLAIAKSIARNIRASSGGLPGLKAIGVPLSSRGLVQVSMNLTDFERTRLDQVMRAVRREAAARGVEISEVEFVGLVPRKAVEDAAAHDPEWAKFDSDLILENRLASAGAIE